jgi:ribosomal protein S4
VKRRSRLVNGQAVRPRAHNETRIGERHVTKRTSAKYKLDRRMGENVFGRPKSPVNRREYGPGQHGQRRKSKISDYRIQRRPKPTLKFY